MKNKIGLISLPKYYNYGTQLQLFALQKSIELFGYECEVIQYIKDFTLTPLPRKKRILNVIFTPHRLFIGILRRIYNKYFHKKRLCGIEYSKEYERKYIKLGTQVYTCFEDFLTRPPEYDAFVVGSDQVWHPIAHLGEDVYFLSFTNYQKKIAYSPSIGVSEIPPQSIEWLRNGIKGMKFLSVRENTGAKLIKDLTDRDATVVVDPTLLLPQEYWIKLKKPISTPKDYILLYALCGDRYIRNFCKILSKKLKCLIIVLPKHPRDVLWFSNNVTREFDVGPGEFISLISNAKFVITDSFHGTIFSLIFKKQFFSFKRYDDPFQSATFSRIDDILGMIGLQDRIVTIDNWKNKIAYEQVIDYSEPYKILNTWIKTSKEYLKNALYEATGS